MTSLMLGKYTIVRKLGTGSTGSVYLAHDPALNRDVAIKVILPRLTQEPGFYERFHREARTVTALRHPHIVPVYDFAIEHVDPATDTDGPAPRWPLDTPWPLEGPPSKGCLGPLSEGHPASADDQPFMVMEYLDGGSLKDTLAEARARGRLLPLPEVTRIVMAIASALDYAHGRGVIHRDVKPANILFRSLPAGQRGPTQPALTDFGVARIIGEAAGESAQAGPVGTPAYLSPEQVSGASADASSDVYALGVVLYEMVCGHVPSQVSLPGVALGAQVNQTPPPSAQFNPNVPTQVQAVLLKALAKQPDRRYTSAGSLAAAFMSAITGVTGVTTGTVATRTDTPADTSSPNMAASPTSSSPLVLAQAPTSATAAAAKPESTSSIPASAPAGAKDAEVSGWMSSASALVEAVSPLVGQGLPKVEHLPEGRLRQAIKIISFVSVVLAAVDFAFRTLDRASQQFTRITNVLPYLVVPALAGAFVLAVIGAVRASTRANRRLSIAAASALVVAGAAWGAWQLYHPTPPPKGPVVLVAEFKGCPGCPSSIIADDIFNDLLTQSATLNFPVEVRRVRENDHALIGDTLSARQLGEDSKATLVIWGGYDTTHVSPQFELLGALKDASPLMSSDDLRSFSYELGANTRKIEHVTFLALGLMRYQQGDYENALSLFDRAVNSLPANQTDLKPAAAYFYRANARMRTGKPFADVESDLKKALEYSPASAAIQHNLSIAYLYTCKPDGTSALDLALAENQKVIDSGRKDANPFKVRGWIFELMDDPKSAADAYAEALNRDSTDTEVRSSLAKMLKLLGPTADPSEAALVLQPSAPVAAPITATTPLSVALAAADRHWNAQEFDQAALGYQQAISIASALPNQPADVQAQWQTYAGMAQLKAGQLQAAAASLEASLRHAPRYFGLRSQQRDSPYVLLGMTYHQLKNYSQALDNYGHALQVYPCDANTLVLMSETLLEKKQYDEALQTLTKAAVASPASAAVDFYRGVVLDAMGRPKADVQGAYQAAATKFEAQVKREPGNTEAIDQLDKVRKLLDADTTNQVLDLLTQAADAGVRRDFDTMRDLAQQAVTRSPDNALAHRLLGRALRSLGQGQAALSELQTAQKLAPSDSQVYYELGAVDMLLKQDADAAAAFRKAVEIKPDDTLSWQQLTAVLWRMGRLDEARSAGQHTAQLSPNDPFAQGLLGAVLVDSQAYTDAVPVLQQAVTLSPTYALAWQYLAGADYRLGHMDEAISAVRKARDIEPQNAATQASYAFLLAEQGRASDAFGEAQRAIALKVDSNNPLLNYALGVGYAAQGKTAEANAAFKAVVNSKDAEPALKDKARTLIK